MERHADGALPQPDVVERQPDGVRSQADSANPDLEAPDLEPDESEPEADHGNPGRLLNKGSPSATGFAAKERLRGVERVAANYGARGEPLFSSLPALDLTPFVPRYHWSWPHASPRNHPRTCVPRSTSR
jgi:hypothetical protein